MSAYTLSANGKESWKISQDPHQISLVSVFKLLRHTANCHFMPLLLVAKNTGK